ncbi:MAG: hypothetical protein RL173_3176 [Fibrobacterota bacterium]|jgi:hypothetical protein
MPRWLGVSLAFFLVAVAGFLLWGSYGGMRQSCVETPVDSLGSPDGIWQIRSFHSDCGRARGLTTRIAVRKTDEAWTKSDRGTTDSGLIMMFADKMPVTLGWATDTLWMSCTGCTKAPIFWKRTDGQPFRIHVVDSAGTALKAP